MPDRYQEITPIGKYKNIWLVLDRDTGKVYVRKCLETFNQEVYERVARLHNVHIPGIAAWKLEDGRFWLIEEYVNGETLEEWINRGGTFTREEAVRIVRQVCEALACLHSQEPPVIHRDVKLSNIMISHDGVVKLIDYNAARLYEKGLKQDTRLIGTEAYAAPEQFGFAQTDARTDIYALGVVFNYLLTGVHVKDQIAEGDCGAVIRKCTQMDPKQRYQSVWELDQALQVLQRNGSAGAAGKMAAAGNAAETTGATETTKRMGTAEVSMGAETSKATETAERPGTAGRTETTERPETAEMEENAAETMETAEFLRAKPASAPRTEKEAGFHREDRYTEGRSETGRHGPNGRDADRYQERKNETNQYQEDGYEGNKHVGKQGIWPIPGFRSGVWWKKLLAVAGYLFIIYVSLRVEFEVDAGRPLALWTDRILVLISLLLTVAVYTDYHGAAAKMPLLRSKKGWIRRLGYCMVWPFIYGILILIEVMVTLLFQAVVKI